MIIVVSCAMIVLFITVLGKRDTGISHLGNNDPGQGDPAKRNVGKHDTGKKVEVSREVP